MMLEIVRASSEAIPVIRKMADIVFRETYADILSPEQMEYMLDWMYSESSLEEQVNGEGKWFYIAEYGGVPAGYVSFELEDRLQDGRNRYHLQKLYVLPEYQKSGLGSRMLDFVKDFLKVLEPSGCRIELNVNRANCAVGFYEHSGLHRDREGDFPIGNGYYMNDFIYAIDI